MVYRGQSASVMPALQHITIKRFQDNTTKSVIAFNFHSGNENFRLLSSQLYYHNIILDISALCILLYIHAMYTCILDNNRLNIL